MITSEDPARLGRELRCRYTAADLGVLTGDEARRFIPDGAGDPQTDLTLAWELLYRLEPGLYERLSSAERLHPGILDWLPRAASTGSSRSAAGAGRLTLELIDRGRRSWRSNRRPDCGRYSIRSSRMPITAARATVTAGFLDDLPVASACADLVVACSVAHPGAGAWRRRRPG